LVEVGEAGEGGKVCLLPTVQDPGDTVQGLEFWV